MDKISFEILKENANKGDIESLNELAYIYDGGYKDDNGEIIIEKDISLAIEYYTKAIEKGSSTASHNLATIYRDIGDYKKAFTLYQKSQELSSEEWNRPVLSFSVGLCYLYGIGIEKDTSKAVDIFEAISRKNDDETNYPYEIDEANFILGQLYLSGIELEEDIEKAREYLLLANKDSDHRSAQELLWLIGQNKQ
ncbi:TPR repeat protein [Dysgonomonas sp. PFB1-18]|uniref:tetratricopeptide repeat protein n=1 Tax=unclassified Dysgonomonas TaxID=2630389 RepID=UPI0024734A50|nr:MULTISPECIES: tetratricopeptide repeat protein [unclassified Dysgonomonas]MDL2302938.1 sel1 repeat family protein [Dysgonomonas sp. OttesenSCG-928-D17]MDH6309820.1 TPR repeat protein [Dysgonomonas sp. PF1-14]MDH6339364.1 TPR repeat protein [Dysgonomonas sp. PF1-16]MDH6380863.1 TPR repeat protein [Dysgonomonas sp. PFB1-18]MDH6397872.1 TPR repeat protein [Dysgonomonas sp. PF1-23]